MSTYSNRTSYAPEPSFCTLRERLKFVRGSSNYYDIPRADSFSNISGMCPVISTFMRQSISEFHLYFEKAYTVNGLKMIIFFNRTGIKQFWWEDLTTFHTCLYKQIYKYSITTRKRDWIPGKRQFRESILHIGLYTSMTGYRGWTKPLTLLRSNSTLDTLSKM